MYSQSETRTKGTALPESVMTNTVMNPRRIVDYLHKTGNSPAHKATSLPSTTKAGSIRNQSSPHATQQTQGDLPAPSNTFPVSRGAQSHSPKSIAARIYNQDNPMNLRQTGMQ